MCRTMKQRGCITQQVRGLDFNSNASNLLASGAADGETLVWDLTNPQAPNSFKVVRAVWPSMSEHDGGAARGKLCHVHHVDGTAPGETDAAAAAALGSAHFSWCLSPSCGHAVASYHDYRPQHGCPSDGP
jgi:WD40 repeat protein